MTCSNKKYSPYCSTTLVVLVHASYMVCVKFTYENERVHSFLANLSYIVVRIGLQIFINIF